MGKVIREFETEIEYGNSQEENHSCTITVKFRGETIDIFRGKNLDDAQRLLANAGYKTIPWTWPKEKRVSLETASV